MTSNETKLKSLTLKGISKEEKSELQSSNRSNSVSQNNLKKTEEAPSKEAFSKFVTQTVNPKAAQKDFNSKKQASPSKKLISAQSLNLKYLLPQLKTNKKTLVLDLDETLIHSNFEDFPKGADIKINVKIDNALYKIFAMKRPGAEAFLDRMSKIYELVIYTASLQQVS
jgi:TFIIF-interacting CTD phosphatase-like protein